MTSKDKVELKPMAENSRAATTASRGKTFHNDLAEVRRKFTFSAGERPSKTNIVLELCAEIELLRAINAELGRELSAEKIQNHKLKQQFRDLIKP